MYHSFDNLALKYNIFKVETVGDCVSITCVWTFVVESLLLRYDWMHLTLCMLHELQQYVAVSGLPDRRKDHAVAMAKFAHACLKRMRPLCKRLEIQLGPDTGDLNIRVGKSDYFAPYRLYCCSLHFFTYIVTFRLA